MSALTEQQILSRARAASLENVKNLNFWGSDICDVVRLYRFIVSVLRKMPNVEVLSLSVNGIYNLKDFAYCPRLRELYLRRNSVADIKQIGFLKNLPRLRVLWLSDNPCAESPNYRSTVLKTLPRLTKLDNIVVDPEEVNNAAAEGHEVDTPDGIPSHPDVQDTTSSRSILGSSMVNNSVLQELSDTSMANPDVSCPSKAQNLVDETNRLRAELGLKQLDLDGSARNTKMVANATAKSPSYKPASHAERPASGDSRNANILSAVLTLVRELDKSSLLELRSEIESRLQEHAEDDEEETFEAHSSNPAVKEVMTG